MTLRGHDRNLSTYLGILGKGRLFPEPRELIINAREIPLTADVDVLCAKEHEHL